MIHAIASFVDLACAPQFVALVGPGRLAALIHRVQLPPVDTPVGRSP